MFDQRGMFVQKFNVGPQEFTLSCQGEPSCSGVKYCADVPVSLNVTYPCNHPADDFAFPNDRQDEIISVLSKNGLPEKCIDCLKKVK